MSTNTTRDNIVEAADRLFYQKGFEHTSFTEIADAVGISRGNFYYHFKSKDDILEAVIAHRVAKTTQMLAAWGAANESPVERIRSFVQMLIANREPIMQYGCPVGTLCAELAKLKHFLQGDANKLFALFRNWLTSQFLLLGCDAADADGMAMHLLMRSQGIAALAAAFQDESFIRREVASMNDWLDTLLEHRQP